MKLVLCMAVVSVLMGGCAARRQTDDADVQAFRNTQSKMLQNTLEREMAAEDELRRQRDAYIACDNVNQSTRDAIAANKVQIGMTAKEVTLSWGAPDRVNRTVVGSSVHEQWVYGITYLYLQNGTLTSFQETR